MSLRTPRVCALLTAMALLIVPMAALDTDEGEQIASRVQVEDQGVRVAARSRVVDQAFQVAARVIVQDGGVKHLAA